MKANENRYSYGDGESSNENAFQGTSFLCKYLRRHFFQNITTRMFFTRAAMVLSGEQRANPVSEHKHPVTVSRSGAPRCALHGQTSLHGCCPFLSHGTWLLGLGLRFLVAGTAPSGVTCLVMVSWAVLRAAFLSLLSGELQVSQKLVPGSGLSTFLPAGLLFLAVKWILWFKRNYF